MNGLTRDISAQNQAAWVRLVIRIILNDFALYYGRVYFFIGQVVIDRFFVCVVGYSYPTIANGIDYILYVHVYVSSALTETHLALFTGHC